MKKIFVKDIFSLVDVIKEEINKKGPTCDLNFIDVSQLTDLSRLFSCDALRNFNGDISKWNVSNVRDMSYMFADSVFNGDISNWDVSNVKNMNSMFRGSKFNGRVDSWDVSNVKDMSAMFSLNDFNGDI